MANDIANNILQSYIAGNNARSQQQALMQQQEQIEDTAQFHQKSLDQALQEHQDMLKYKHLEAKMGIANVVNQMYGNMSAQQPGEVQQQQTQNTLPGAPATMQGAPGGPGLNVSAQNTTQPYQATPQQLSGVGLGPEEQQEFGKGVMIDPQTQQRQMQMLLAMGGAQNYLAAQKAGAISNAEQPNKLAVAKQNSDAMYERVMQLGMLNNDTRRDIADNRNNTNESMAFARIAGMLAAKSLTNEGHTVDPDVLDDLMENGGLTTKVPVKEREGYVKAAKQMGGIIPTDKQLETFGNLAPADSLIDQQRAFAAKWSTDGTEGSKWNTFLSKTAQHTGWAGLSPAATAYNGIAANIGAQIKPFEQSARMNEQTYLRNLQGGGSDATATKAENIANIENRVKQGNAVLSGNLGMPAWQFNKIAAARGLHNFSVPVGPGTGGGGLGAGNQPNNPGTRHTMSKGAFMKYLSDHNYDEAEGLQHAAENNIDVAQQ